MPPCGALGDFEVSGERRIERERKKERERSVGPRIEVGFELIECPPSVPG